MRPLITHIPHYALGLALVVLYYWMERSERRNEALAGDDGEIAEGHELAGPRAHQALGLLLGVGLFTSVGSLMWHSTRGELPGWSLVLTYIGVGLVAALWIAWNVPGRLPAPVAARMGAAGRGALRGVVMVEEV